MSRKTTPEVISPHIKSLIEREKGNLHQPLHNQFVFSKKELKSIASYQKEDYQDDMKYQPVKGVVHRYPYKALLCATWSCLTYCRYCFRGDLLGAKGLNTEEIDEALEYIRSCKDLNEIMLSGGDPLSLSNDVLKYILSELESIEHIKFIRIHSRGLTHHPKRFDAKLMDIISKCRKLNIVWHVNHESEITEDAKKAIYELRKVPINIYAHTVLLKEVNDQSDTLKDLFEGLLQVGVTPYYLFQCDPLDGIEHFRVPLDEAIDLYKGLVNRISGIALPKFVIELPKGGGKVPVDLGFLKKKDKDFYHFESYQGDMFEYPIR